MADIDVVPKHHSNAWLWIVLAIVVIAALFWAFAGRTRAAAQLQFAPAADVVVAASIDRVPISA
jgi:bacteriorhodopsin